MNHFFLLTLSKWKNQLVVLQTCSFTPSLLRIQFSFKLPTIIFWQFSRQPVNTYCHSHLIFFSHHNLLFNIIISHYNEPVSHEICVSGLNISMFHTRMHLKICNILQERSSWLNVDILRTEVMGIKAFSMFIMLFLMWGLLK